LNSWQPEIVVMRTRMNCKAWNEILTRERNNFPDTFRDHCLWDFKRKKQD
jgi:hypothetical protein